MQEKLLPLCSKKLTMKRIILFSVLTAISFTVKVNAQERKDKGEFKAPSNAFYEQIKKANQTFFQETAS